MCAIGGAFDTEACGAAKAMKAMRQGLSDWRDSRCGKILFPTVPGLVQRTLSKVYFTSALAEAILYVKSRRYCRTILRSEFSSYFNEHEKRLIKQHSFCKKFLELIRISRSRC